MLRPRSGIGIAEIQHAEARLNQSVRKTPNALLGGLTYPPSMAGTRLRSLPGPVSDSRVIWLIPQQIPQPPISYGGELGLVFALKYPDMLKSLVVCSAVSYVGPLLYKMVQLWRYACALEDPEMFYYATLPLNFSETFLREQTAVLEQAKARYEDLDFPPLVRLIDAFLMLNISDQLPLIKTPTCVIAGENDILKPTYPYSKLIHDSVPNSEMVIIRDSGHAIMFDKPEEFNSVVLGFLCKHSQKHTP